jgi:hypothetical protein
VRYEHLRIRNSGDAIIEIGGSCETILLLTFNLTFYLSLLAYCLKLAWLGGNFPSELGFPELSEN